MARLRLAAHAAAALTLSVGLMTAAFANPASACSCFPNDTEGARYQRAQYVFHAQVLKETLDAGDPAQTWDDRYRYTVRPGVEYKGDVPRRLTVTTSTSGAACGIRLSVGQSYLVFAHGDASDGVIETMMCSGTRLSSGGPPNTTPPSATTTPPTTTTAPSTTCATGQTTAPSTAPSGPTTGTPTVPTR
ncbi:hypothetical protein [Saccharothrix violaceirubra]|uniref:Tissue inhibitor of metalloproteinase n=1 Tax=Saccharothrix violaceirubra TaxID=413306 RepID=A0A7W7T2C5_9PSEU|nr:hypothetical protein [Saccharothrix violaceirubra]MBB4964737.1 hypothetical protein [Saccharothrix violaceirubra]